MNKTIVAVILGALILVLIGFLFVGDAQDTTVLKVGDKSYELDDFLSYVRVWNYEDDTSTDLNTMFSNYQSYKVYSTRAEKAGVELEEGELPAELESGDAEVLLTDYNLTSGEYMRVKTEIAKANKLYGSPYELGKISSSYFDDYKKSFVQANGESVFDTFHYRIVEIPLEPEVEVEDENAEVINDSGEVVSVSSDGESGDEQKSEEIRKSEAKTKAEKVRDIVIDRVKNPSGDINAFIAGISSVIGSDVSGDFSGDIFAYIGANIESPRYVQNTNGFSSVQNGELTSTSKLYFAEDMTGTSSYLGMFGYADDAKTIVAKVSDLSKGEVSDVFETSNGYAFAYMEDVTNGLDSADETRFLNEVANAYIGQNAKMTFNKIKITNLKIEDIIPKLATTEEATSGDAVESTDVNVESNDVAVEPVENNIELENNDESTVEVEPTTEEVE